MDIRRRNAREIGIGGKLGDARNSDIDIPARINDRLPIQSGFRRHINLVVPASSAFRQCGIGNPQVHSRQIEVEAFVTASEHRPKPVDFAEMHPAKEERSRERNRTSHVAILVEQRGSEADPASKFHAFLEHEGSLNRSVGPVSAAGWNGVMLVRLASSGERQRDGDRQDQSPGRHECDPLPTCHDWYFLFVPYPGL
jgi:hypothetical protein